MRCDSNNDNERQSDDESDDGEALYLRPKNCATLAVPKINPEIWMKLNRTASRQDLQTANI